MKKVSSIIISILAVFAIGFTACSSDNNNNDTPNGTEEVVPGNNHKVLIAYFSEPLPDGVDASTSASRLVINDNVVGSVEYLAQLIRQNTGGDMVRIQTATPYPGNFDDLADQANQERQNNVHPALSTNIEDFDNYDVVFVGYPIWWYQMPMAMYSFFDKYDFKGKTIIPFATSGSSAITGSAAALKKSYPALNWKEGRLLNRADEKSMRAWLDRLGY